MAQLLVPQLQAVPQLLDGDEGDVGSLPLAGALAEEHLGAVGLGHQLEALPDDAITDLQALELGVGGLAAAHMPPSCPPTVAAGGGALAAAGGLGHPCRRPQPA